MPFCPALTKVKGELRSMCVNNGGDLIICAKCEVTMLPLA